MWNDVNVELLKTLWNSGTRVDDIAAQLDTTRNAIIGKAHRLELTPHPVRHRGYGKRRSRTSCPQLTRAPKAPRERREKRKREAPQRTRSYYHAMLVDAVRNTLAA